MVYTHDCRGTDEHVDVCIVGVVSCGVGLRRAVALDVPGVARAWTGRHADGDARVQRSTLELALIQPSEAGWPEEEGRLSLREACTSIASMQPTRQKYIHSYSLPPTLELTGTM